VSAERSARARSPKDTFITVYGRRPVLEALDDERLRVDKVILAEDQRGEPVRAILAAAKARGVPVQRASAHRVKVLAGNGRHDQGVLADVVAPRMAPVAEFVAGHPGPAAVLVLDGVTNPANVGMLLRSATAAGLDGVLLPRRGVPSIDPMVVKASAGVAFRAPVLRAATAAEGCATLREAGFAVHGLDARGSSLLEASLPERVALVLGGETAGLSPEVRSACTGLLAIPMDGGVESLNVASAGAVAAFELRRRRG
jgi:23S rRNA (guanosine2251-2'-O)-methyltransferase